MSGNKVTIKDVAKEAGVSTATVSMVITGKGKISNEKTALVIETINRLGYKRNRSSSKLDEKQKKYVGLVVYCDFSFQWWFAKEFILEIKSRLLRNDIYTLMFNCDRDTKPQELYDNIMNAGLSGVLVLHYNERELFSRLASQNIPLVLVNNNNYPSEFNTVCSDDYQGAYEGTKKLIEMGHRHILYIDYPRPFQPATVFDRLFGFRKAIEESGIPFPDVNRIQVDLDDVDQLKQELTDHLKKNSEITAFFIHDDYQAVRVYQFLQQMDIRIPEDISILAPGDTLPYSEPFIPMISTMQVNQAGMATHAVKIMIDLMQTPDIPIQSVKTLERYINRGSCRKVH